MPTIRPNIAIFTELRFWPEYSISPNNMPAPKSSTTRTNKYMRNCCVVVIIEGVLALDVIGRAGELNSCWDYQVLSRFELLDPNAAARSKSPATALRSRSDTHWRIHSHHMTDTHHPARNESARLSTIVSHLRSTLTARLPIC